MTSKIPPITTLCSRNPAPAKTPQPESISTAPSILISMPMPMARSSPPIPADTLPPPSQHGGPGRGSSISRPRRSIWSSRARQRSSRRASSARDGRRRRLMPWVGVRLWLWTRVVEVGKMGEGRGERPEGREEALRRKGDVPGLVSGVVVVVVVLVEGL